MGRETKEEKAARIAALEAEQEKAFQAYLLTVPKRLMDAVALAKVVGVHTDIELSEKGPLIQFSGDDRLHPDQYSYESVEWELLILERQLADIKEEQDERARLRALAEDLWKNRLTTDERRALKEFIGYFRVQ